MIAMPIVHIDVSDEAKEVSKDMINSLIVDVVSSKKVAEDVSVVSKDLTHQCESVMTVTDSPVMTDEVDHIMNLHVVPKVVKKVSDISTVIDGIKLVVPKIKIVEHIIVKIVSANAVVSKVQTVYESNHAEVNHIVDLRKVHLDVSKVVKVKSANGIIDLAVVVSIVSIVVENVSACIMMLFDIIASDEITVDTEKANGSEHIIDSHKVSIDVTVKVKSDKAKGDVGSNQQNTDVTKVVKEVSALIAESKVKAVEVGKADLLKHIMVSHEVSLKSSVVKDDIILDLAAKGSDMSHKLGIAKESVECAVVTDVVAVKSDVCVIGTKDHADGTKSKDNDKGHHIDVSHKVHLDVHKVSKKSVVVGEGEAGTVEPIEVKEVPEVVEVKSVHKLVDHGKTDDSSVKAFLDSSGHIVDLAVKPEVVKKVAKCGSITDQQSKADVTVDVSEVVTKGSISKLQVFGDNKGDGIQSGIYKGDDTLKIGVDAQAPVTTTVSVMRVGSGVAVHVCCCCEARWQVDQLTI